MPSTVFFRCSESFFQVLNLGQVLDTQGCNDIDGLDPEIYGNLYQDSALIFGPRSSSPTRIEGAARLAVNNIKDKPLWSPESFAISAIVASR